MPFAGPSACRATRRSAQIFAPAGHIRRAGRTRGLAKDGEERRSRIVELRTAAGPRWFVWEDFVIGDADGRMQRDAERRPRHHRAARGGASARRGPRSGDGCEQGQVALPRLDEPRDQDPDERHSRHDRPAARHRAVARAAHLCARHLDLGQDAAVADRRGARLLQDRGRQDRAQAGAVRHRRCRARRDRAVGAARPRQGSGDRLAGRARPAEAR